MTNKKYKLKLENILNNYHAVRAETELKQKIGVGACTNREVNCISQRKFHTV